MFWQLALATFSRLDSVVKIVCFAHIGQFLNVFSFPSKICDYSSSFLSEPLSTSQCSHTNSHILHFSFPLHQSSSKGMDSVSFSICVTYLVIYLIDCVFFVVYLIVEYGYLISNGLGVYCWCFYSDSLCFACIMS